MPDNPATPPSERLTEEITLLLDSMGLTLYDLVLPKKKSRSHRQNSRGQEACGPQ